MRVKDFSKSLALLMIYLMISLTIFSASVFATIVNPQAYGNDKVPGIIRQTDSVVFKAESTFPLSISSYFTNNNLVAMSCSGANGNFNCSYSTSVNSITGPVSATLRENSPGTDEASVEAYPDFIPPTIQNMVPLSLGNRVRAVFSIVDQSSPSYPGTCSGFKKVELFLNNQLVNTTNYSMGICSVDGEIIGTIPNYVGQVNTSLKITDYMGFTDNFTGNQVLIATKKPVIRQTVKVYKPGTTTEVKQVSTKTDFVRDVDVSIEIESSALALSGSVFGDFTEFDKTNSIDQSNIAATCDMPVNWTAPYTCTFHNIKLSPAGLNPNFVVSATDQMENFANTTLKASFAEHPGATIGSAKVYKAGTIDEIKIISTNASSRERMADISVDITDSVEVTNTVGDFAEIHRNLGLDQSNHAQCSPNEAVGGGNTNSYTCLFQNLRFNPAVTNPKITIRVTDETGKETEKNLTLGFTAINNGGTVTRLGPEPSRCVSGMCYVRETGNNITAEISTSSTYFDSNVRLQDVPAACTQESRWICQQYVNFNLNDKKIYLEGTDDLGNQIAAVTNITVDNAPPVKLTNFTSSPRCPISSETLKISMNVSEQKSPGVIISADTSAISSDEKTTASCTKIGTTKNWNCVLNVKNLKEEEINTELQIIIEDLAGNQVAELAPLPVSVCIAIDEIPNMISEVKTIGTLPKVDKKTASKLTQGVKTPVGLEIVMNDNGAEIVDRTKPSCVGAGLQGSPYTINDEGLKPIIILPLKYDQAWDVNDSVMINCSQEFKIKIGNRIYTEREPENYTISLSTYNQPLGSLNQSYNDKMTSIKKQIQTLDKKIQKYTKTYDKITGICALAEGLGKINALLQAVRGTALAFCLGFSAIPFLGAIGQFIWKAVNGIAGKYQQFVDNTIWPQGWVPKPGNSIGLVIKGTCAIYTCKFYDFNTFVSIGMSFAMNYLQKKDEAQTAAAEAQKRLNVAYTEAIGEYGDQDYHWDGQDMYYDSNGVRYYVAGPKASASGQGFATEPIAGWNALPAPGKLSTDTTAYNNLISSAPSAESGTSNNENIWNVEGETGTETSAYTAEYGGANHDEPTGYYYDEEGHRYSKDANGNMVAVPTGVPSNTGGEEGSNPPAPTSGKTYTPAAFSNNGEEATIFTDETGALYKKDTNTGAMIPINNVVVNGKVYYVDFTTNDNGQIVNTGNFFDAAGNTYTRLPLLSQNTIKINTVETVDSLGNYIGDTKWTGAVGYTQYWKIGTNTYLDIFNWLGKPYSAQIIISSTPPKVYNAPSSSHVIASDQLTGKVIGDSQNQITGGSILDPFFKTAGINTQKTFPGWSSDSYAWFDLSARLNNALGGFLGDNGNWVLNPYKSKHYDALCIPAIGFNDRKERQLLCKRLGCLQQMQKNGGPIEACEFDYSLGMCMYVDSARYKLEGPANIGVIFKSVLRAFFSNVLGNGIFYAYSVACQKTGLATISAQSMTCLSPSSFKAVACGVMGSWISLREVISFAENPYNPMKSTAPTDPVKQSGGIDFCSGVNYQS